MPAEPRWLDPVEDRAWRGVIALMLVGIPEIERRFRRYGLVHIEYGILAVLSEGSRRMYELAEALNISPSRLSHRMRKLSQRGLVVERPCDEDGRVILAEITAGGRALLDELAPQHVHDVRRVLFDHLDRTQVRGLADALQAVAAHLPPARDA
jgi:DNA-binding MarR family transcriptional regulator